MLTPGEILQGIQTDFDQHQHGLHLDENPTTMAKAASEDSRNGMSEVAMATVK